MRRIHETTAAAALAAFALLSSAAIARADWTRVGNTITDASGWTLKVEAKTINGVAGLSLQGDAVTTKGTPAGVLDLSGAISDGSVIVELNDYALRISSAGTLYSVILPDTVIRIGGYVFQNQTSLTNVVPLLPPSVKIVGTQPFYNVPIRGALDLSSVTNMTGGHNFRTTSITSVVYGAELKTVPTYAFENCGSLRSVRFNGDLQTIDTYAFSRCSQLADISPAFPATVTSIGGAAFNGALYAGRVELLNPDYTTVNQQFFASGKVSEFAFGIGVTTFANYAFDFIGGSSRAWNLYMRGGVPTVGTDVFRGTSDYKLRIFYPFYDDAIGGWREWVAANTTPLTSAQTNAYVAAYPGETIPAGLGNSGSVFYRKYFVPWAPPALATNALHVVGSVTRNVVGAGEPALGEVVPAYGIVENVANGSTIACSAPATGVSGGVGYACAGYVLETLGASGWENPVTNLASTSFTYTQSGSAAARRLTWLWRARDYKLTVVMPDLGDDTVSYGVQPDAEGYLPAGTVVSLAANASGSVFRRWHLDVPAGQDPESGTISVTMDAPKTLLPEFVRDWLYTAGSPATIRDGYWTLKADGAGSELTLPSTCMTVASPIGELDLEKPISGDRIIVSLGNLAFVNNAAVKGVVLPTSLQALGADSFHGCSLLASVTPFLPGSVASLGGYQAFCGCFSLSGDLRSAKVSVVTDRAFKNARITSAILPAVVEIKSQAFLGCPSLTNVVLSPLLETVGNEAFYGCANLGTVYFEGNAPAFTRPFAGINAYTIRMFIPRANESWEAFFLNNPGFAAPTDNEILAFQAAYPGERLPIGTWVPPGGSDSRKQWVCTWTTPRARLRTTIFSIR